MFQMLVWTSHSQNQPHSKSTSLKQSFETKNVYKWMLKTDFNDFLRMPNTSDSARTSSTLPSRSWTEETGREKSRSRVIWSNQKWLEGKKFSNWRWECSTVFLLYVTKTIVKISFMYSMLLRQILHLSVFDETISKICFRPLTNHYLGR